VSAIRNRLELTARRMARPVIERLRPVLLADQSRALDAARANIAALEVLVDDLNHRVAELEAERAAAEHQPLA
jgi:hypothetical protein